MKTLVLKNISKIYRINKSQDFYALRDVNLSFECSGLHAIVGKSGSGKSTLLNMIANLDTPSRGEIYLNSKKYTNKKLYKFYQNEVSVVFQQYHLLEDETVLYNVYLPLLIKGVKKKNSIEEAKRILGYVNISESLFNQKCKNLSGGEKQRVAIARAIIKNPRILICDEPTGALDSDNSIRIMGLLKSISKSRLVIVISHNLQLVNDYSDRIIELSDGRVINDYYKSKIEEQNQRQDRISKGITNWTGKLSLSNYKKRFKRHLFVSIALSISLIMGNLVSGFLYGKDDAIRKSCYRQLDFGSGTVSKEEFVSNSGMLKLVKSVRPDFETLSKDPYISSIFEICTNFSAILPSNINITYDELYLEDLTYNPIYSFDNTHLNTSLIIKGNIPDFDSLNEVVLNKYAYNHIQRLIRKEPLNEYINFINTIELNYVTEDNQIITDTFKYNVRSKIVGVVDELSYLSSCKVYYSYIALENYMQEYVLNNLSTYYANKITWYDRVFSAENYSYISSYSYLLFLKDYRYRNYLFDVDLFNGDLSFTSNSIVISNSLINFLDVAKYALVLFLIISIIGAVLITSIISFTNYSEDRKYSAILSSLGATNGNIEDIYVNESLYSAVCSLVLSFAISYPLSLLINQIIFHKLSVQSLIVIPFLKLLNIPLLYPFSIAIAVFFIVILSTLIPIKFSKHNSIKEELQNND